MEAQINKVVKVTHVKLEPIERSIQVNLQPMTNDVKPLFLLYDMGHIRNLVLELFVSFRTCQIISTGKKIWEWLQKILSNSDIILSLLPLIELLCPCLQLIWHHLCCVFMTFLELGDIMRGLNKPVVSVRINSYGILFHISHMFVTQELIDLPKLLVIVLLNTWE